MSKTKYAAIPTVYKGVQFRSRLEARWAAFFDLQDIQWEYEPVELAGYIPDFQIKFFPAAQPWLFEVKPAANHAEFFDACRKIDRSRWDSVAYVGGTSPNICVVRVQTIQDVVVGGTLHFAGEPRWHASTAFALDGTNWNGSWVEAGNITQYRSPRGR
jgi:hypothetical protein